ncbi:MAG: hypothetical protein GXO77_16330 [Calditrichaeota bacterium]|nr:hypothetical protein [Calditrichota bacterium]
MKKLIVFGIWAILFPVCTLVAQINLINGFVRNSVYVYSAQKEPASTDAEMHTRLYQSLRLDVGAPGFNTFRFHFAGRTLTDLNDSELRDIKRFKAYRLSISGHRLFNNLLDFELGRQFLYPGVILGSLDGLNLLLRPFSWTEWQLYGGIESHLFRAAKVYNPDEATVFGARIKFKNLLNTNWHLIYLQKNYHGKAQWRLAGVNLSNYSVRNLTVLLQSHYDLLNRRLHRFYLSARYQLGSKFLINAYFKRQYPQVYNNSYFQIFRIKRYLLSGFNFACQLSDRYTVTATVQGVQLEEGYGNRFIVSLGDNNGSVGLLYESGDLGNQSGVVLDYRYALMRNLFVTLSVDFSRYRFEKRFDYENQLANALGLTYRFSKHWNTRLEYQWLKNADFKSDQRLLNHISFVL